MKKTKYTVDSTLSIPLNASWTNSSVDIKANHYPQGFPYLNAQNLWWDPNSKSINSYGGGTTIAGNEGADEVDPLSVWAFKPEDNSWSERYAPDDDIWDTMTRATRCASAYTPKSGYCLGGYSGPWSTDINTPTTNIPLGGMVEFDFETATWSNVSSVGSSQRGWTISQQMEYLPSYGKKGVLVAIGGHDLPEQEEHEDGKDLRSMANITIYDINTSTWHSQNATGDIPYGRTKFCSVAVQGGNNDTYEMSVNQTLFDAPFCCCMAYDVLLLDTDVKLLDMSSGATAVLPAPIAIRYISSRFRPSVGLEPLLPHNLDTCIPANSWVIGRCSALVAPIPRNQILSILSTTV